MARPDPRVLVVTTTGKLEQLQPELWMACSDQWHIVAYGKTRLAADLRLDYALNMMLRRMHDRLPYDLFISALARAGAQLEEKAFEKAAASEVAGTATYTTHAIDSSEAWTFSRSTALVSAKTAA